MNPIANNWICWYNVYMNKCLDCGKELKKRTSLYCKGHTYLHRTRPSGLKYTLHKENPTSFKKGFTPWNAGTARGWVEDGYRKYHTKIGIRREHRIIMEKHIGRRLKPDEIVHHIDYNKTNNSIDNLTIMNRSEHLKLHWKIRKQKNA